MSDIKVEGTIQFDGLLQGRIPDEPEFLAQLRSWIKFVEGLGLHFQGDISDSAFSLLPETAPISAARLGVPAEHAIQQAIEQLVALYPAREVSTLSSTLRSREIRPQEEVQTIYLVSGRTVRLQTRSVEAETTPPPEPLTPKQKLRLGLAGLGMAVLLLGVALLIPGVRNMFHQVFETVRPIETSELKIELGPYAKFIKYSLDEQRTGWTELKLTILRTDQFPTNAEKLNAATESVKDNVLERLALENLLRRHVQVELISAEGKFVGQGEFRIADLYQQEKMELRIAFPTGVRVTRIEFVP